MPIWSTTQAMLYQGAKNTVGKTKCYMTDWFSNKADVLLCFFSWKINAAHLVICSMKFLHMVSPPKC